MSYKADAHDKMDSQYISIILFGPMCGSRGGTGGPDPFTILDRIPWNSQNNQASIQCWAIIGTPAKRRFAGGPMMARFYRYLDPLSLKKEKKTLSEFGSRSDPNGIQERMFRQFKHLECDRKHTKHQYRRISDFVVQKPMRTRSFSAPIHDIFRDYKRFVCKR